MQCFSEPGGKKNTVGCTHVVEESDILGCKLEQLCRSFKRHLFCKDCVYVVFFLLIICNKSICSGWQRAITKFGGNLTFCRYKLCQSTKRQIYLLTYLNKAKLTSFLFAFIFIFYFHFMPSNCHERPHQNSPTLALFKAVPCWMLSTDFFFFLDRYRSRISQCVWNQGDMQAELTAFPFHTTPLQPWESQISASKKTGSILLKRDDLP